MTKSSEETVRDLKKALEDKVPCFKGCNEDQIFETMRDVEELLQLAHRTLEEVLAHRKVPVCKICVVSAMMTILRSVTENSPYMHKPSGKSASDMDKALDTAMAEAMERMKTSEAMAEAATDFCTRH